MAIHSRLSRSRRGTTAGRILLGTTLVLLLGTLSSAVAADGPASQPATKAAAAQKDVLDRYCTACHNERAKTMGMESAKKFSLDAMDISKVSQHRAQWKSVVHMLQTGMMPPPPMKGPDRATTDAMIAFIEKGLKSAPKKAPAK